MTIAPRFFITFALMFVTHVAFANLKITTGEVGFLAKGKPGFLKIKGEGAKPKGQILDGASSLNGEVTIDLKELTTGISMRDQHMKEKYLEVEKYPEAKLKIQDLAKDILSKEDGTTDFKGTLTLHGVEKPVAGTIKSKKSGDAYETSSQFTIKITDYGITLPEFTGIKVVDDVEVQVSLNLEKM